MTTQKGFRPRDSAAVCGHLASIKSLFNHRHRGLPIRKSNTIIVLFFYLGTQTIVNMEVYKVSLNKCICRVFIAEITNNKSLDKACKYNYSSVRFGLALVIIGLSLSLSLSLSPNHDFPRLALHHQLCFFCVCVLILSMGTNIAWNTEWLLARSRPTLPPLQPCPTFFFKSQITISPL